jgi:hypothetical protein
MGVSKPSLVFIVAVRLNVRPEVVAGKAALFRFGVTHPAARRERRSAASRSQVAFEAPWRSLSQASISSFFVKIAGMARALARSADIAHAILR